MLVHLGGQDSITAYNIEVNELWRPHVVTAVSQVAAIYVFVKSWPKSNVTTARVDQAALDWAKDKITHGNEMQAYGKIFLPGFFLFFCGITKCVCKPWDLKRVSVNSLVDSSSSEATGESEIHSLQQYVGAATRHFEASHGRGGRLQEPSPGGGGDKDTCKVEEIWKPYNLCVDLSTDQNRTDVSITYALLWSALVMVYVLPTVIHHMSARIERLCTGHRTWPDQVAQYNLLGYVARSRKYSWLMAVVAGLGCRDLVDQLWTMKPCKGGSSSKQITGLVHGHVAGAWTEGHIAGTDSFRAFNDYRGQWTLNREITGVIGTGILSMSVSRPFDESVLVWHVATDFCFHLLQEDPSSPSSAAARRCREMSNYMAYLLFVKPEMMMPGARRNMFKDACGELTKMLEEHRSRTPRGARGTRGLAHKVIEQLKSDGVQGSEGGSVVRQAWSVAEELMDSHKGNEEKMWTVIQGVWVEMLCFSASRCKGYLHAKSLGTGGEYLSYVWLLLLYMGMETLAEKMQRTELYKGPTTAGATIGCQNV